MFKLFKCEPLENGADKGILRARKILMYIRAYMNFSRLEKMPLDVPLYKGSSGRSMVEMLGVLAIIGVLSVGGIAGYNRAMLKHRLNVHAQGVNFLIMNAIDLKTKLDKQAEKTTHYASIFNQLNLIPDGFHYNKKDNDNYIYDNTGNKLFIYYNNEKYTSENGYQGQNDFWGIGFPFAASRDGIALCQNVLSIAKEHSQDLWLIETYKFYSEDSGKTTIEGNIYGDKYCNGTNIKCISSMSFKERDDLCSICDDKSCIVYVLWK